MGKINADVLLELAELVSGVIGSSPACFCYLITFLGSFLLGVTNDQKVRPRNY